MTTTGRSRLPVALLVPALLFVSACRGNDGDDGVGASGGSTTTTEAGASGSGSGTFVVGDRTFSFEAEPCRVDEPGDGDALGTVDAEGEGTFDSRSFTITIKSSSSERSLIETVQIVFSMGESLVGTNSATLPGGADEASLEVTGDGQATGTIAVLGTGGQPSGEGLLTLRCDG